MTELALAEDVQKLGRNSAAGALGDWPEPQFKMLGYLRDQGSLARGFGCKNWRETISELLRHRSVLRFIVGHAFVVGSANNPHAQESTLSTNPDQQQ